ncbi:hypothetical protein CW362_09545 [Streptomyces populi]|uniref:Post-SET domain-containing protein n=1 Tax=Streptomyces populi TaxID=2058924 RepID=A0A2I0STC2_9ACTN|nr:hypothetical protein [Streptomyces populi]PKT73179.1 hypothetical protein CW362_09545 [Streptomyces populi]
MTETAAGELDDRVRGRSWTVRLDPVGRGSTAVRVSCSRPNCAQQRLASAADGRQAAVAHLKAHLKAAAAPRPQAFCACKAESCRGHLDPGHRQTRAEPWRCGGAVVLAVVADREGRWWQVVECCSRCAAATPGAKVVSTAPAVPRPPTGSPSRTDRTATASAGLPQFSAPPPVPSGATAEPGRTPRPRPAPVRRGRPTGKIAQRVVPPGLQPVVLRDELVELGDLFRAYQQRAEPDLSLLAELQDRKARAFSTWAEVTGDGNLRLEAQRAEQAAATARSQYLNRTGRGAGADGPAVDRLLTTPTLWEHARSVLAYAADHSPLPGPEARLLVLMLTLRAAHSGTGNLVGQDIAALGLSDPHRLLDELTGCGWLRIPGTADELLASRPENAVLTTVPSLLPRDDGSGPFTFGKKARAKVSGWAQKVTSDKKLRKAKATPAARLLALTLATRATASGLLGPEGQGIARDPLAACVAVDPGELQHLVDQLTTTDWLAEATLTDTHLVGRQSERVLPLTCPLTGA